MIVKPSNTNKDATENNNIQRSKLPLVQIPSPEKVPTLTLKDQLTAIQETGRQQDRNDEFISRAIIYWLEWNLAVPLNNHPKLQADPETYAVIIGKTRQTTEIIRFLQEVDSKHTHLATSVKS